MGWLVKKTSTFLYSITVQQLAPQTARTTDRSHHRQLAPQTARTTDSSHHNHKPFPAPSLNMMNKNLIWSGTGSPRLTVNWNSDDCCYMCHHAEWHVGPFKKVALQHHWWAVDRCSAEVSNPKFGCFRCRIILWTQPFSFTMFISYSKLYFLSVTRHLTYFMLMAVQSGLGLLSTNILHCLLFKTFKYLPPEFWFTLTSSSLHCVKGLYFEFTVISSGYMSSPCQSDHWCSLGNTLIDGKY